MLKAPVGSSLGMRQRKRGEGRHSVRRRKRNGDHHNEQRGDALDKVEGAIADGCEAGVVAQVKQGQGSRAEQAVRQKMAEPVPSQVPGEKEEGGKPVQRLVTRGGFRTHRRRREVRPSKAPGWMSTIRLSDRSLL
jgi:hypothetical protein